MRWLLLLCAFAGALSEDVQVARDVIISEGVSGTKSKSASSALAAAAAKSPVPEPEPGPPATQSVDGSPGDAAPSPTPKRQRPILGMLNAVGINRQLLDETRKFGQSFFRKMLQQGQQIANNPAGFRALTDPEYARFINNLPPETYNAISGVRRSPLRITPESPEVDPKLKEIDTNPKPVDIVFKKLFNNFLPALLPDNQATAAGLNEKGNAEIIAESIAGLIPGMITGLVALGKNNQASESVKEKAHELAVKSLNPQQLKILSAYIERTGARSVDDISTETLRMIAEAKIDVPSEKGGGNDTPDEDYTEEYYSYADDESTPVPKSAKPAADYRRRESKIEKESMGTEIERIQSLANPHGGRDFKVINLSGSNITPAKLVPQTFGKGSYLDNLRKIAHARKALMEHAPGGEKGGGGWLKHELDSTIRLVSYPVEKPGEPHLPNPKPQEYEYEEYEDYEKNEKSAELDENDYDAELTRIIEKIEGKTAQRKKEPSEPNSEGQPKFTNEQIIALIKSNPGMLARSRTELLEMAERYGVSKKQVREIIAQLSVGALSDVLLTPQVASFFTKTLPSLIRQGFSSGALFRPRENQPEFAGSVPHNLIAGGTPKNEIGKAFAGLTRAAGNVLSMFGNGAIPPPEDGLRSTVNAGGPASFLDMLNPNRRRPQGPKNEFEEMRAKVEEFENKYKGIIEKTVKQGDNLLSHDSPAQIKPSGYNYNDWAAHPPPPQPAEPGKPHGIYLNSYARANDDNIMRFSSPNGEISGDFGTKTVVSNGNSGKLTLPKDILSGEPLKASVHSEQRQTDFAIADLDVPSLNPKVIRL